MISTRTDPATVVFTWEVAEGREDDFEEWAHGITDAAALGLVAGPAADRGDLALVISAYSHAVAGPYGAREHAHTGGQLIDGP